MFTTVKKHLRRLPLRDHVAEVEIGYLSHNGWIQMGDLNRNLRLKNLSKTQSNTLIFLIALGRDEAKKQILKSLMHWIFEKNNRLIHNQPFAFRYLMYQFLRQKRTGMDTTPFQGYALIRQQLYSLNEGVISTVFIYRKGTLLEFQIEPQHFIPVETEDIVLFSNKALIDILLQRGLFPLLKSSQPLSQALQHLQDILSIANTSPSPEFRSPLLILRQLPAPALLPNKLPSESGFSFFWNFPKLRSALIGGGLLLVLGMLLLFGIQ